MYMIGASSPEYGLGRLFGLEREGKGREVEVWFWIAVVDVVVDLASVA